MERVYEGRVPEATTFGSYGYAWQQLQRYFLYFFLVTLVVALFESPVSIAHDSETDITPLTVMLQIFAAAYFFLLFPVISYGGNLLYLHGIRNEKMEIEVLFQGFKNNYFNIVLAHLLKFAIIGIGFVFFIIPGIILACRLAFVSLLIMDKNMEPIAAIEKSWEMTRGHGWRIFGMALLAIPIFIAGLICFIIGAFISVMWIGAAFTALYHAIDLEERQKLDYNLDTDGSEIV